MWPIVAILAIPLIEIALFVLVGGRIGLWPTLGLVVAAGLAGAAVIRAQGVATVAEVRRAFDRGEDPAEALLGSTLALLAGVLLIVPGFATDLAGLALLIPGVRRAAIARLRRGMALARQGRQPGTRTTIIEGTWHEVPDAPGPADTGSTDPGTAAGSPDRTASPTHPGGPRHPSGWTRH